MPTTISVKPTTPTARCHRSDEARTHPLVRALTAGNNLVQEPAHLLPV